jgi:hypothetical protein
MPNDLELKRAGGVGFVLPPIKSMKIGAPVCEKDLLLDNDFAQRIMSRHMAIVADQKDKLLVEAVIDYAKRSGCTELHMIDEEFVRTALVNEAKRREKNA